MDNENDEFPCIGICTPDPASGLCEGCGRPLEEPAITAYNERKQASAQPPEGSPS